MRMLVALLIARAAYADVSMPAARAGGRLPATDGRWPAYNSIAEDERPFVTLVELATGKTRRDVRRVPGGLTPMRVILDVDPDSEDVTLPDGVALPDARTLELRAPLRRTLDLTIRDRCWDEPRERAPRWIKIFAGGGIVLVEYWSNRGSCMCGDPLLRRVVTRARTLRLPDDQDH